jgi:hypothetical protein
VVRAVVVWKIDNRAGRDREDVGDERLVPLIHAHTDGLTRFERAARRRLEINHRSSRVGKIACGRGAEVADARPPFDAGDDASNVDTPSQPTPRAQAPVPQWSRPSRG